MSGDYMTTGSNKMEFNQATIQKVFQMWFDEHMKGQKITSVKPTNNNYHDGLIVTFEGEPNE